jgi:hypothetical protein
LAHQATRIASVCLFYNAGTRYHYAEEETPAQA